MTDCGDWSVNPGSAVFERVTLGLSVKL